MSALVAHVVRMHSLYIRQGGPRGTTPAHLAYLTLGVRHQPKGSRRPTAYRISVCTISHRYGDRLPQVVLPVAQTKSSAILTLAR